MTHDFSTLLEVFPFTDRMALLGSQEAAKQAEIEARMKPVGILRATELQ